MLSGSGPGKAHISVYSFNALSTHVQHVLVSNGRQELGLLYSFNTFLISTTVSNCTDFDSTSRSARWSHQFPFPASSYSRLWSFFR